METFKKRQKEMLRLEKQREKTARRLAKKRGTLHDPSNPEDEYYIDPETGLPIERPAAEGADGVEAPEAADGAPGSAPAPAVSGPATPKDGPA
jgi:hypothetical protein